MRWNRKTTYHWWPWSLLKLYAGAVVIEDISCDSNCMLWVTMSKWYFRQRDQQKSLQLTLGSGFWQHLPLSTPIQSSCRSLSRIKEGDYQVEVRQGQLLVPWERGRIIFYGSNDWSEFCPSSISTQREAHSHLWVAGMNCTSRIFYRHIC